MVIVSATMSTLPCWMYGIRWAEVMATSWILSGLPKIARATSFATSMSKPSIWPLAGLRYPNRKVFWSTPTRRNPRAWIWAIVEPAGMWAGAGRLAGGRRLARGLQVGAGPPLELGTTAGSWTPTGRAAGYDGPAAGFVPAQPDTRAT